MEYQEGQVLFGRYRISGAVKKGGMGAVYRAVDLQFPGRGTLALKEMLADIPQDEIRKIIQEKFEEEARVLVQLSHPGIPRVWDHFVSGDLHYIVMEFIEGESLDEVLRDYLSLTGAPVPPALAVDFGVQLCDILEYLHTRPGHPILHRDLKPGNIIVRREAPRVVLVDFGLARGVNPLSMSTRTAVGTLGYASLEQLRGQPDVRSDLYSLGATLHHLVGGQVPVPFEIPRMQRVLPSVHPDLAAVIDRAVAQEPRQRFQTATEFRQALQDVQRRLEVPREEPAGARRPAKTLRPQQAVPDPPTPRPTREGSVPTGNPLGATMGGEASASGRNPPARLLPWQDEPGDPHQGATLERRAGANPARRPARRFSRQALALGVVACTAIALLTVFYHLLLVPSGALGPSSTAGTDNGTSPTRAAQGSGPPSTTAIDASSRPVAPPRPRVALVGTRPRPTPRKPTPLVQGSPVPVRTVDVPAATRATPVVVKTVYVAAPSPVTPPTVVVVQTPLHTPPRSPEPASAEAPQYPDPKGRFTFNVASGFLQAPPEPGEEVRFVDARDRDASFTVSTVAMRGDLRLAVEEHDRWLRAYGVTILHDVRERLGTWPGHKFWLEETSGGRKFRAIQVLAQARDGACLLLTCRCRAEGIALHDPDFKTFLDHFQIL